MLLDFWQGFLSALTNGNTQYWPIVVSGLAATIYIIYRLGGRGWAVIYVALIPFLNWSFAVVPNLEYADGLRLVWPTGERTPGSLLLHPMAMVTGLVFVVRDFVQREMHQKVLVCMGLAIGWSFFYAWPVIALASGLAFAISEFFDWLMFTFTKYRLSTRIVISSAVAAPIDTTVFLYGAGLARHFEFGEAVSDTFNLANIIVFIIGKMVGAVIVSRIIRAREDAGKISAYEA
ncbi:MAG: hypothetical protein AAGF20_02665 [Pseudomonadota bacterium]